MATADPAAPDVEGKGGKWYGALKVTLNVPVDKAWAMAGNFCEVDKWFQMDSCEKVEGEYQQPGCVRHLVSSTPDGGKSSANEKLLSIDDKNYTLSYELLENSFGLDGYVNNFKLLDLGNGTTAVDWAYSVNPSEGKTEEMVEAFLTGMFRAALTNLENLLNSPSS